MVEVEVKAPYTDPRFDRSVDAKTGFRTRTILCMRWTSSSATP